MLLAREALRICTVQALRADTRLAKWAIVRDSEQGPLEDFLEDKPLPQVIVYTDGGQFGDGETDLLSGGPQDLVLEVAMTQVMQVDVEETSTPQWVYAPPPTDAAMELTIGCIERLVIVALTDPQSAWAEMWRKFALNIGEIQANRGSSMRDGVLFAGRQIVLPVTLPKDPVPGDTLGQIWSDWLDLVDAEPDLAAVAGMLRAMVTGQAPPFSSLELLQAAYGLTTERAKALQLDYPPETEGTEPTFQAAEIVEG